VTKYLPYPIGKGYAKYVTRPDRPFSMAKKVQKSIEFYNSHIELTVANIAAIGVIIGFLIVIVMLLLKITNNCYC
jgi:hypothetical protein